MVRKISREALGSNSVPPIKERKKERKREGKRKREKGGKKE
jgi:hypothetical protein